MKKLNNKKGISLIVLVITIIVMIILAAAIILALDGSGIIGKAREAKIESNIANAKELLTLSWAEWELMTGEEREANGGSFVVYARNKLKEAIKFYSSRITTLLIDMGVMFLLVTTLSILSDVVLVIIRVTLLLRK